MSTKTTFKRIALVTVAALSFGLLTSVTPASAISTGLVASVGPNGATSLTVISGTDSSTAAALIRLDVTNSDTTTVTGGGLGTGETITGTVSLAPTGRNSGSMADTSTPVGLTGTAARSDFIMLESIGQSTSGARAALAADAVSAATDWTKLASGSVNAGNLLDSATVGMGSLLFAARAADGKIGQENTGFINMDTTHELTSFEYVKSYYVTVRPRTGADVINKGAYTFSFALVDNSGILRQTATVKIDFVGTAAQSDAVLGLTTSGTFLAQTDVATYDSTSATWVKATINNRDGGLIRTSAGAPELPIVVLQSQTTLLPTWADSTASVVEADSGSYGNDWGTNSTASPGNGTNRANDGVVGVKFKTGIASNATTGLAFRMWAAYGNATIVTSAITIYEQSGTGTASANYTDVLVTAAGMSLANQAVNTDTDATDTWTLPTTTTSATLKFWIKTSSETATPGALITAIPTWTGTVGTSQISPATSTTGTVYTTDALGNFTVTVTNSAPVSGATLSLALSGGDAFGAGKYTAVLTWATPAAATIAIADPIAGISVLAGSTNVTTVIVKDQFGNPVKDQVVTVSTSQVPAVVSTTVISPITTNAAGTATYSFTPAAGYIRNSYIQYCSNSSNCSSAYIHICCDTSCSSYIDRLLRPFMGNNSSNVGTINWYLQCIRCIIHS